MAGRIRKRMVGGGGGTSTTPKGIQPRAGRKEAVELISSKQDTSGRWALENSYRGSLDYAEGTTGCDCMAHRRRSVSV